MGPLGEAIAARAVVVGGHVDRAGRAALEDQRLDAFALESGFIAYQVARTGDRAVASITMFHEHDQAERSNELAAEWVAESLADFEVERMGVMGGEVMVSRAVADLLEPAHH